MELTIEQALLQGVSAHKKGKLQDAERLYRAILESQPVHPDANHNLGVLAVSVNKAEEALPLFETALESNPKIEQFWLSYIDALIKEKQYNNAKQALKQAKKQGVDADRLNSLEAQLVPIFQTKNANNANPSQQQLSSLLQHYHNERFAEAEKLAVSITQKFPEHPFGWKVLGAVLKQISRISESFSAMQKSALLEPQDAEVYNNLGITLRGLGRLKEAEANCRQAIALMPALAEAHNNLGITLQELGRLNEAEASYNQVIALKPHYALAHNNLGNTLKELGQLDGAQASYNQAIALKPDYANAHSNLGVTLQKLGRLDDAQASYTKSIALKPDYAIAHNNLSVTLKELGRLGEAEAICNQAIVLKPDYAEAHRHLTLMKKFDGQDEQHSKMIELYLNKNISEEQRCHINFGLAKACEDLGDFEQAFTHYSEGNVLRKKLLNYDIGQDVERFQQIKSSYPLILQNTLEPDNFAEYPMPIFIVGMPRSGTTLVEQVISSHSEVTGAGELDFVSQFGGLIARGLSEINTTSLLEFRSKYLAKLRDISKGNWIVADKMPQNFRFIGLLAATFPEAKIVHVKRNSAAVCWANYKQYFVSKNLGFCYALDDIIGYYKLYTNLMEFWESSLSERIYELDYEKLTFDQETETHQLINYLDLNWDEKCLSPQDNMRSVATASNIQVRKKVYQGSSEKWKKYEPFLNGVFDDLLALDS
jgi:tetratricopeptide (TPR) repeat protein